jgi:hypothetical protein
MRAKKPRPFGAAILLAGGAAHPDGPLGSREVQA